MVIVVGAGLSGAVLAERLASSGRDVLVIEQRPHVGGNCCDFTDQHGILVPRYGPHFFHTSDEGVWSYLQRFARWRPYEHRVLSAVDGKLVPVPVNITTVNELFGLQITGEEEMRRWLAAQVVPIPEPRNSEEAAVSRVGWVLYEKMFKHYTRKQWDLWPAELDAEVMNRIPVRTTFDDRYFSDAHQAMPADGYTAMVQRMLDHPAIEVRCGVDFFEARGKLPKAGTLVFTGRIDQYFADRLPYPLRYRSLRFEFEHLAVRRAQAAVTINYPNEHPWTRVTEPKFSTGQEELPGTTLVREYPTWEGDPYYPVLSEPTRALFRRYQALAAAEESRGVFFAGRLANYRYFNMDQAVRNALDLFERLERLG
jgi:UDP-galactopyranose mutase